MKKMEKSIRAQETWEKEIESNKKLEKLKKKG